MFAPPIKKTANPKSQPKPKTTANPKTQPKRKKPKYQVTFADGAYKVTGRPVFSDKRKLDEYMRAKFSGDHPNQLFGGKTFAAANRNRGHTKDWHEIRGWVEDWANSKNPKERKRHEKNFDSLYGTLDHQRYPLPGQKQLPHHQELNRKLHTYSKKRFDLMRKHLALTREAIDKQSPTAPARIKRLGALLNSAPPNLAVSDERTNKGHGAKPDLNAISSPGGRLHGTPNAKKIFEVAGFPPSKPGAKGYPSSKVSPTRTPSRSYAIPAQRASTGLRRMLKGAATVTPKKTPGTPSKGRPSKRRRLNANADD
ncbi:MAG: hypothetical protein M3389_15230 [Actinomycetota bacterium]|nr:hypothetical protein [Actinomycetota bacterium]